MTIDEVRKALDAGAWLAELASRIDPTLAHSLAAALKEPRIETFVKDEAAPLAAFLRGLENWPLLLRMIAHRLSTGTSENQT